MAIRSLAMLSLEAEVPFAQYPIDDDRVRSAFANADLSTPEQMEIARELTRKLLRKQNERYEKFVDDFLAEMVARYLDPGSREVSFAFFNTDTENAVTIHVSEDNSFAIGLDYGMPALFAFVFPTLLHANLKGLPNLEWLQALTDIVQRQFYPNGITADGERRIQRRIIDTHYLTDLSSIALELTIKFLVLHELGHIHLGHFKAHKATPLAEVKATDNCAEISTFDHDLEFAADAFALQALEKSTEVSDIHKALGLYVPSIFFGIFSIAKSLYRSASALGRHFSDSHPDSWTRAQRLLPPKDERIPSPDPRLSALGGLFDVIAAERVTPQFIAAVAHIQRRMLFGHR